MDPVVADKCLSTLGVADEDKFHRPFRKGEDKHGLVGLFVYMNKPHVPCRDPDEGRHVGVAANCGRVSRCILLDWEDQDHQKRGVW
jgi:hypothetical protein